MALVIGQLAEAGDPQALEYFKWISRFTVGRFINDDAGFCRAQALGYYIAIRDSANKFATTWSALFQLNWPTITSCDPNRGIDGDFTSAAGYGAYARGMLGNAASLGIPEARDAYTSWRRITPKLSNAMAAHPTWAVVPRSD